MIFVTSIITIITLYLLYYYKFSYYIYKVDLKTCLKSKNKPKTKIPPPFPNGWFKLISSDKLKKKSVEYIEALGHNFAVFRGEDGKSYVMDAYCPHLGANLAIGGHVEKNCITCPFHGWKYEGETGLCVNRKKFCDKNEINNNNNNDNDNNNIDNNKNIYLKKYKSIEINNEIFVWNHSENIEPLWNVPEIDEINNDEFECRGETIQTIESHIQDIPENIADARHFLYVHKKHPGVPLYHHWTPKWKPSTDNDFDKIFEINKNDYENMDDKSFNDLIDYINNKKKYTIKPYTSTLIFDHYATINILNKSIKLPFEMKTISFQIGPGIVYIFIKTSYGNGVLIQTLTPLEKNKHKLVHKLYIEKKVPYFFSAIILYGEGAQVMNDANIWCNKIHVGNPVITSESDKLLMKWRKIGRAHV